MFAYTKYRDKVERWKITDNLDLHPRSHDLEHVLCLEYLYPLCHYHFDILSYIINMGRCIKYMFLWPLTLKLPWLTPVSTVPICGLYPTMVTNIHPLVHFTTEIWGRWTASPSLWISALDDLKTLKMHWMTHKIHLTLFLTYDQPYFSIPFLLTIHMP